MDIPNSTVKRILADLLTARNLIVQGAGRGTRYSIAVKDLIKQDVGIVLTNESRIKEYLLLTPKIDWKHPNEWSTKLNQNGLYIIVNAITSRGATISQQYSIAGYYAPNYYQPVFIVKPNIVLLDQLGKFGNNSMHKIDYPVKCSIELSGSIERFDFDVMLVTDQG